MLDDLNRRAGKLAIDKKNWPLDPIRRNAFRPKAIGEIDWTIIAALTKSHTWRNIERVGAHFSRSAVAFPLTDVGRLSINCSVNQFKKEYNLKPNDALLLPK